MPTNTQLIGFEKDAQLGALFAKLGISNDYKAELPEHLLTVLRKQNSNVVIESLELLEVPKSTLGGMQEAPPGTMVRVQTFEVPLDLRLVLRHGDSRSLLDIQLVMIAEGFDSTPTYKSEMFIKAQRAIDDA
jgi:hypothetical protein